MAYYKFLDEYSAQPYGSCEVFEVVSGDHPSGSGETLEPGWYWWACFPGCLPDGDPVGPFETEEDACEDAEVA